MQTLIKYLQQHSINVLSAHEGKIVVEAVYSKDGVAFSQEEVIEADFVAVRDWLGY